MEVLFTAKDTAYQLKEEAAKVAATLALNKPTQEEPFSNREIREMFNDIKKDLGELIVQTRKTNGRVNALENWKGWVTGVGATLVVVVLPIVGYIAWRVVNPTPTVRIVEPVENQPANTTALPVTQ